MLKRPLLAETADELSQVILPAIGTPKLDGYRCLQIEGDAVSRNFKPIRNTFTRERLRRILPNGIDGELMLREKTSFNEISSAFSAHDGTPDFVFHAFDYVKDDLKKPYIERLKDLEEWLVANPTDRVVIVPYTQINTYEEIVAFEQKCADEGYEGAMFRKASGPYKCNRSTLKEQILLKYKRWHDSEGLIVGITELERNQNEKESNELGLTDRSSKKEGMVAGGTMGTILILDPTFPGVEVEVGTGIGWTKEFRQDVFDNPEKYINKQILKYKYQLEGMKDKPRFPSGQGLRDINDMDADHPLVRILRSKNEVVTEENQQGILESFFQEG